MQTRQYTTMSRKAFESFRERYPVFRLALGWTVGTKLSLYFFGWFALPFLPPVTPG